jgi:ATP-dependent RNA helicase DHX57
LFQRWLKICSQSHDAGRVFARENFLSWDTLVRLSDIKQQLLELLASIGFIHVEIGPRQPGNDNILNITGPEVSKNSKYFKRSVTFFNCVQFAYVFPHEMHKINK